MSVASKPTERQSVRKKNPRIFNSAHPVSGELYSLLGAVDSESIADQFEIGKHSPTHDFDNHVKIAVREGLDPSRCLVELANKVETDKQLEAMAASTFSRYTTDCAVVAVGRFLFTLLHTPQLYHQRAVQRTRLEWPTRGVVAVDATNFGLTRSVVVSDEFIGDDGQAYEIGTGDGRLELHCAARVEGGHKHPLVATAAEGGTHESP